MKMYLVLVSWYADLQISLKYLWQLGKIRKFIWNGKRE